MNEKALGMEVLLILMSLFLIVLVVVSSYVGKSEGRHEVRTEAVKAGVGKWNVASDGTSVFEWIKP